MLLLSVLSSSDSYKVKLSTPQLFSARNGNIYRCVYQKPKPAHNGDEARRE
jgi:hypothetical protein